MRKRACDKSIISDFRGQFHQAGVGSEVGVSLPIRLNALYPTENLQTAWKLFEMVSVQVVEPKGSTSQEGSVRSFAKCSGGRGRNSLGGSKSLETIPIVPEDAIVSAHPNEARTVLVDSSYREVVESVSVPEGMETVLLGTKNPWHQ